MKLAILALNLTALAFAQLEDKSTEHRSYSGVMQLEIDNINGFVEVTGGNGNTVEADVARTLRADSRDGLERARKDVRLEISQSSGLLRMKVDRPLQDSWRDYQINYDFTVRVPRKIRLDLHSVNGRVSTDSTAGDFTVRTTNGRIDLTNVEGSGSASTVNGSLKAIFTRNPSAASSFKSVNGTLDVTFRPDLNADLTTSTLHGGVYTDFPVTGLPIAADRQSGRQVWRGGRMSRVRVGRGGPEMRFETVNGRILIRNRG